MSKDVVNEKDFTPLSEQAAHWWAVLHDENASAADYREFSEWILRSPERVEAILQTARLMRALESKDVHWPDTAVETLVREAQSAPTDVVVPFQVRATSDVESRTERRRARAFLPYAAGIAAVLVTVAVASWYAFTGPEIHRTALGEQRSVVLEDGSLVTLNTSSQIEAGIDDQRRVVRLVAGEALFQVAHETQRPFDVIAGDATVRAVGTQFNVDRHSADTVVTVVEGKVVVQTVAKRGEPGEAPRFLTSAERAVIKAGEISATEPVANLAAATAWTQRRLVFERRPLGEVAAEFNRYNRRLIVIDSVELRDQEVTGVFQANDPDSFVAFLAKVPGVKVTQNAGNISVTAQD